MEKENEEWMKIYNVAKKYYEENGNLLIPYNFNAMLGGETICLGCWIERQRKRYNGITKIKLSNKQIGLLEDIKMVWSIKNEKINKYDEAWLNMYKYAKEYYEINKDLLIPKSYYILNDGMVINLGIWIRTQRRKYKEDSTSKLSEEQIKLLEDIGMIWDVTVYKRLDKFLKYHYDLYEKNLLDNGKLNELINKGIFGYIDGDIKVEDTIKVYRKLVTNNKNYLIYNN